MVVDTSIFDEIAEVEQVQQEIIKGLTEDEDEAPTPAPAPATAVPTLAPAAQTAVPKFGGKSPRQPTAASTPASAPAPSLAPERSEELDYLREQIVKYYEMKTLKDAAIVYNIETSTRGSNKRKLAGQDELFQRAGATGQIYAQFGGKIIKSRNLAQRINTEDEKTRILKYFPDIEKFNMGMNKIGYPLQVEKNGRGKKTKKPSVPEAWTIKEDGTDKLSDTFVRLRRYGPDLDSHLFTKVRTESTSTRTRSTS